ncbi:neuroendocrine protein 7B2 isoform X1 [Diorhabda carinulata]|uniref:neuroendocrine protein 7B2 isoform X1 n=1 Tax=Diorhabda carinulata TaxID=1163345 RepID=UPI0025A039CA|nr:neuroendocrine protein 7B2 isoform X1 [Diorhabda carinulata]
MKLVFLLCCVTAATCYIPQGKGNILSGLFLRDLVNRINGKQIAEGDGISYLDFTEGMPLDGRSLTRGLEEEPMFPLDYDSIREMDIHPSIRDQEYLKHSTLWSKQFPNGDRDEVQGLQHGGMKTKDRLKSETTLPAYCSPPNPCPVGYTATQGCIEDFENTATFSRRYQAAQDCMCDTEHMFECPDSNDMDDNENTVDLYDGFELERMLQSVKLNQLLSNTNMITKKFLRKKDHHNPFLNGEKLPVAAKKGNNVIL